MKKIRFIECLLCARTCCQCFCVIVFVSHTTRVRFVFLYSRLSGRFRDGGLLSHVAQLVCGGAPCSFSSITHHSGNSAKTKCKYCTVESDYVPRLDICYFPSQTNMGLYMWLSSLFYRKGTGFREICSKLPTVIHQASITFQTSDFAPCAPTFAQWKTMWEMSWHKAFQKVEAS